MLPIQREMVDLPSTPPLSQGRKKTPAKSKSQIPTAKWRKQSPPITPREFTGSKFSEVHEEYPPIWYFRNFFDDHLIAYISYQSNLYCAQEKLSKNLGCRDLGTTPQEIQTLLGVFLFMGIYPNPNYRMYWGTMAPNLQIKNALDGGVPRFEHLKRFLHFNDNASMPTDCTDKLYKIRPVLESVREKCRNLEQEEYNAVDEQMIPTKSRSSIKQYMPKKPHKWGYKVFSRCGSSGMLYDFEVYTGSDGREKTELGATGDLVVRLCSNIPKHQNYKVYFDNYFTSIPLIRNLREEGIQALGTIRANRTQGADKLLRSEKELKKEGRGASDWRTDVSTNVTVLKWLDNSVVHLASGFIPPSDGPLVRRWSKTEKSYLEVACPQMVHEYNKFMGGVDLCDMLLSLYRVKLKSRRWYMAIFYYLLKVAVTNAWLLYRRHCDLKSGPSQSSSVMSLQNFQSLLAFDLINAGKVTKRGRPSSSGPVPPPKKRTSGTPVPIGESRYDQYGHFPIIGDKQNRCRLCAKGKSNWKCSKCNVFLCITSARNCFYNFHMK